MTEEEIRQGLFLADSPDQKVICYIRELEGLAESPEDPSASFYIDLKSQQDVDEFAQSLRQEVVHRKVPATLSTTNIRRYKVNVTSSTHFYAIMANSSVSSSKS